MPISAVDTITLAFQHTKRQLLQPFRFWQWTRSGGGRPAGRRDGFGRGFNFLTSFPHQTGPSRQFLQAGWPRNRSRNSRRTNRDFSDYRLCFSDCDAVRQQRDAVRSFRQRAGEGMSHPPGMEPQARPRMEIFPLATGFHACRLWPGWLSWSEFPLLLLSEWDGLLRHASTCCRWSCAESSYSSCCYFLL